MFALTLLQTARCALPRHAENRAGAAYTGQKTDVPGARPPPQLAHRPPPPTSPLPRTPSDPGSMPRPCHPGGEAGSAAPRVFSGPNGTTAPSSHCAPSRGGAAPFPSGGQGGVTLLHSNNGNCAKAVRARGVGLSQSHVVSKQSRGLHPLCQPSKHRTNTSR